MDQGTYARAVEAFQRVRGLDGAARERALGDGADLGEEALALVRAMLDADAQATPGSTGLSGVRAELGRLAHELTPSHLDAGSSRAWAHGADAEAPVPERLGPYTILRRVGAGGMGVVYEAMQDRPRRRVALKVVRPGLLSTTAARRFAREAEIVGRLHHHGIAQIFELGTHGNGEAAAPFFSMEFIEGPTLDVYCKATDLRQRVEAMARVCEAVGYAHQHGVVHRDLKPGNVLVRVASAPGEVAMPKVLDFGVAQLIAPVDAAPPGGDAHASSLAALRTMAPGGEVVGTLEYMSPEQLEPSGTIDASSDVYSLGVMLYEVLASATPFPRPSSIVQAARDRERPARALHSVDRRIPEDLGVIVAKAMERDRARRYAHAGELGADLRRYLAGEAILARPPSTLYQARTFARRNRGLVTGMALAALALMVGTGVSIWQARTAARERDAAQSIADFLRSDVFAAARFEELGPKATIADLLRSAEPRIDGRFGAQPDLRADLHALMGDLYSSLGDAGGAERSNRRAIDALEAVAGPADTRVVSRRLSVAQAMVDQGRGREALEILDAIGADVEKAYEPLSSQRLMHTVMTGYARLIEGDFEAAQKDLAAKLPAYEASPAGSSQSFGAGVNLMAASLFQQRRFEEALPWSQRSVDFTEKTQANTPDWVAARVMHARILSFLQRDAEALALLEITLPKARRILVETDPDFWAVTALHGEVLGKLGRFEEGEASLRESTALAARSADGPTGWSSVRVRERLRRVLVNEGNPAKIEQWYRDEVTLWSGIKPVDDPGAVEARRALAEFLMLQGRAEEAAPLVQGVVASRATWDEGKFLHARAAIDVTQGMLLAREGKIEEGVALIRTGAEYHRREPSAGFERVVSVADAELARWAQGQR